MTDDAQELELARRASQGDARCLQDLFTRYRQRLRRMVKLRLDPRVQGRVDPSDVVQEAYLEVCRKLPDFVREPKLPFFLWLRLVTGQKLSLVHRQHLGVQARDAGREVSLYRGALPQASSASLAAQLLGRLTTASQAVLNGMDPMDREILALRHFEGLSNGESAEILGLSKTAANNRYIRDLGRLRDLLEHVPGFFEGG